LRLGRCGAAPARRNTGGLGVGREIGHTQGSHTPRIPVGGSCGAAPVRSEAGQAKWIGGALKPGETAI